jgi:hypothetical protein
MRMRVLNALHWDLGVPRDRLNVNVENGWVTVSGIVDLSYQRICAESDARNVAGVMGVTNLIRVIISGVSRGPKRRRNPGTDLRRLRTLTRWFILRG